MTQKDYIAIAAMLKTELDEITRMERTGAYNGLALGAKRGQTTIIATRMADLFAQDNPRRFKRALFMRACGLEN